MANEHECTLIKVTALKGLLDRQAELEAALKDAMWAGDVFFSQCCGCALVVPQDYRDYEEAEKRIEKARKALPKEEL